MSNQLEQDYTLYDQSETYKEFLYVIAMRALGWLNFDKQDINYEAVETEVIEEDSDTYKITIKRTHNDDVSYFSIIYDELPGYEIEVYEDSVEQVEPIERLITVYEPILKEGC